MKNKANFTKELLNNLYHKQKKSTRKIAKEFGVGKTTIEYHLKKFNILRRTHQQANKLHSKESNWIRGLNKKDPRVEKLSKSIQKAYDKKRKERIKTIEKNFDKPMNELIQESYWDGGLNQEQIAKKFQINRQIIIELMKKFKISKRPKYQYISSLKGKNHSMYGKSWDQMYNKKESNKRRKIHSERFRKLTIRRLENNEFPFFDTKIEKAIAQELLKRKILFVKQFNVDNRFVCDFAIPNLKIIIECDGDYWHANPKIYIKSNLTNIQKEKIQRDKFKDKYLLKKGWNVLRFFESEIKGNIKKCGDKIEEQIKKIKSPIDNL